MKKQIVGHDGRRLRVGAGVRVAIIGIGNGRYITGTDDRTLTAVEFDQLRKGSHVTHLSGGIETDVDKPLIAYFAHPYEAVRYYVNTLSLIKKEASEEYERFLKSLSPFGAWQPDERLYARCLVSIIGDPGVKQDMFMSFIHDAITHQKPLKPLLDDMTLDYTEQSIRAMVLTVEHMISDPERYP